MASFNHKDMSSTLITQSYLKQIAKLPEVLEEKIYRMSHQMNFSKVITQYQFLVDYLEQRFSDEEFGGRYLDKFDKKYSCDYTNPLLNWYSKLLSELSVKNVYAGKCDGCKKRLLYCHCIECPDCYTMTNPNKMKFSEYSEDCVCIDCILEEKYLSYSY